MSLAIKCDRRGCGKYFVKGELAGEKSVSFSYTLYDDHAAEENGYQYHKKGTIDLCPDCTRKLFTTFLGMGSGYDSNPLDDVDHVPDEFAPIPDISGPFSEAISGFLNKTDKRVGMIANRLTADLSKQTEEVKKGWNWK